MLQTSTSKNMWRSKGRLNFPVDGLVYYAPLWHPELNVSPFKAWDLVTPGTHSCTVTGATWGSTGRTFNGTSDYISCGKSDSLAQLSSPFSIEVWIYSDAYGSSYMNIGGKFPFIDLRMDSTNKAVDFRLNDAHSTIGGTVLTNGNWYHVGVVYDSTLGSDNQLIYLNGVLDGNTDYTTAIGNNTAVNYYIGVRADSQYHWGGKIGDVRIYNRALSAGEIQHNYLSTKWRYL